MEIIADIKVINKYLDVTEDVEFVPELFLGDTS